MEAAQDRRMRLWLRLQQFNFGRGSFHGRGSSHAWRFFAGRGKFLYGLYELLPRRQFG